MWEKSNTDPAQVKVEPSYEAGGLPAPKRAREPGPAAIAEQAQQAHANETTRRRFLIGAAGFAGGMTGGLALVPLLPERAAATPASMQAAIKAVTGESPINQGRIKLELPPLVENGNAVPLGITVESPMTDADHVKAVHVFTEKNPQPNVLSVQLGPRAGTANVSTRMRLADTQTVVAIAEMSDGSFWRDEVEVVVTMAACLEQG